MKIKLLYSFLFFVSVVFSNLAQTSDKEAAARNWINEHTKELNIQPFHNFKLTFVRKGLAGETLRFQQMLNDVPVYDSEIVVNFVEGNNVAFSSNNYDASIAKIDGHRQRMFQYIFVVLLHKLYQMLKMIYQNQKDQ